MSKLLLDLWPALQAPAGVWGASGDTIVAAPEKVLRDRSELTVLAAVTGSGNIQAASKAKSYVSVSTAGRLRDEDAELLALAAMLLWERGDG